ncbi:MAG: hypothetical protein V2B18_17360 [Pseudomonadota bacterium]
MTPVARCLPAAFLAVLAFSSYCGATGLSTGECPEASSEWDRAYGSLEQAVEELRRAKQRPITEEINRRISEASGKVPIAKLVESVLQERRQGMMNAEDKVRRLMEREKEVFTGWRRCEGPTGPRARQSDRIRRAAEARERLTAQLPDLMLDEAFVQYKNYSDPVPSDAQPYQTSTGYGRNGGGTPQPSWPYR